MSLSGHLSLGMEQVTWKHFWVQSGMLAMLLVLAVHWGKGLLQVFKNGAFMRSALPSLVPGCLKDPSLTHPSLLLNPPDILEDGEPMYLPMASLAEASIDPPLPQCISLGDPLLLPHFPV